MTRQTSAAVTALAAIAVACSRPVPPPDLARARTADDTAAAIARSANAFADHPSLRRSAAMFDLMPSMPRWLAYRLLRKWRENTPGEAVRRRATVVDTVAAGVPVVWIDRDRRANGVLVYLHGGGYVAGPVDAEWEWLTELATRASTAAVGVVYRMPPDEPLPGALDDAAGSIRALLDSDQVPPRRWILAGSSAGGGLAVAALRALLDEGVAPPAGLLLVAPWVDLALQGPGVAEADSADPVLSRKWLGWAARNYANGTPLSDPRLSPIHTSFNRFPATRIDIGTRDLFLPDNRRLRDRLIAAGVSVEYVEQRGGVHNFPMVLSRPEAQIALAAEVRWIAARLAKELRGASP